MAKPNYSFEKRQRELAKKKKKEDKEREKAQRKAAGLPALADDEPGAGDQAGDQAGEAGGAQPPAEG